MEYLLSAVDRALMNYLLSAVDRALMNYLLFVAVIDELSVAISIR